MPSVFFFFFESISISLYFTNFWSIIYDYSNSIRFSIFLLLSVQLFWISWCFGVECKSTRLERMVLVLGGGVIDLCFMPKYIATKWQPYKWFSCSYVLYRDTFTYVSIFELPWQYLFIFYKVKFCRTFYFTCMRMFFFRHIFNEILLFRSVLLFRRFSK